jgi:hypothetical protein
MIKSLPEINDLGRRYAELPAEMAGISNPAKQELLLELCQCFHPYLMKYLVMICRGHVPILGIGPKVVEAINHELSKRTQFAAVDVRRYVDFDCDRHIRLLCRRGFLTAHEKPGLEEEGIFSGAPAEVCWRSGPLEVER